MVDIDPERPEKLRFVVSHRPTLASSMLIQASSSFLRSEHVSCGRVKASVH